MPVANLRWLLSGLLRFEYVVLTASIFWHAGQYCAASMPRWWFVGRWHASERLVHQRQIVRGSNCMGCTRALCGLRLGNSSLQIFSCELQSFTRSAQALKSRASHWLNNGSQQLVCGQMAREGTRGHPSAADWSRLGSTGLSPMDSAKLD